MAGGRKSNGYTTERGRMTIVGARTSNGARCFSPVLPGENEADWLALSDGINARFPPEDRFEEELCFNLAMAFWQERRLQRYLKAATYQQIEDAAHDVFNHATGDAMTLLLKRGVESLKAELGMMEKALFLIGALAFASDDEPIESEDGLLLLRLAVDLVLKGKNVEQAFSGLPEEGWTWRIVRENLSELCEVASKSMPWLLKTLHGHVLEELTRLRKTLKVGLRGIEANHVLKDGEFERMLLYSARIQNRVAKWLRLIGESRAERAGLVYVRPAEVDGNGAGGDNGDGTLD
jgi:hypothetical protein